MTEFVMILSDTFLIRLTTFEASSCQTELTQQNAHELSCEPNV